MVMDHDANILAKFLECEVICKFGVFKYILVDNGIEWLVELIIFVRIMALPINTQHLNGLVAMEWLTN